MRATIIIRSSETTTNVGVQSSAPWGTQAGNDEARHSVVGLIQQQTTEPSVLVVSPQPSSFYARRGKRAFDLVASLLIVLFLIPVLAILGLALRLSLDKGVFFRQDRVGLNAHAFSILKYRTMEHDRRVDTLAFNSDERRICHKSDADPRHTSVGLFVRKFSLDELPQLFNVIKGDMSLVGPRPELVSVATPDFVDHPRHWVRPGLTGPFQLSELRRTGDLTQGLHLDAAYVGSLSFRNDLTNLLRTVGMVLKGQGA